MSKTIKISVTGLTGEVWESLTRTGRWKVSRKGVSLRVSGHVESNGFDIILE